MYNQNILGCLTLLLIMFEVVNYGLEKLTGDMVNVHFKYYSLLMHILLSIGHDNRSWSSGLCVRAYGKDGVREPM